MQSFNVLALGIACLIATILALPVAKEFEIHGKQFTVDAFELTELIVDRIEAGNTSIFFTIHNPDPLTNMTTDCTGTWPYGSSGWPTGTYQSCLDGYFAWHMKEFVSWTNFTLELKDTFKDPDIGDPPYDHVTIFGNAVYTEDVMSCVSNDPGTETCLQAGNSTVEAPIDRTIAKHR